MKDLQHSSVIENCNESIGLKSNNESIKLPNFNDPLIHVWNISVSGHHWVTMQVTTKKIPNSEFKPRHIYLTLRNVHSDKMSGISCAITKGLVCFFLRCHLRCSVFSGTHAWDQACRHSLNSSWLTFPQHFLSLTPWSLSRCLRLPFWFGY